MSHILTTRLLLVQNDDLPEDWTIFTYLCCTLIKATQLLQRETRHPAIWKQSIELRHELYVAFAVQARAPCCIQKGEKVNVRAVEKGILMASFDSWQDSGLTPTLPLMGGRDPGGTFVQALRLWLFREKWNYESNLAKQCECVCVCVVCKYCKMGREGVMGTTFIHIHLVSCHEHRQHKGRIEGLLWRGIMVMGT